MYFTLIGRPYTIFRAIRRYDAAGLIPSVIGVTLDGKRWTTARVEDVEIVADTKLS